MTFHSVGNFIIPTDEVHVFERGRYTTNLIYIHLPRTPESIEHQKIRPMTSHDVLHVHIIHVIEHQKILSHSMG